MAPLSPQAELSRLLDLMPASGRREVRIGWQNSSARDDPPQTQNPWRSLPLGDRFAPKKRPHFPGFSPLSTPSPQVIALPPPTPWADRTLMLHWPLWQQLPQDQQDLLFLRSLAWVMNVRWLKPEPYQGLVAVGLVGILAEFLQGDLVGVVLALGVGGMAVGQLWRRNQDPQRDLESDAGAVKLALRRGYGEAGAIAALVAAIPAVARLEQRPLRVEEVLRCQALSSRLPDFSWQTGASPGLGLGADPGDIGPPFPTTGDRPQH